MGILTFDPLALTPPCLDPDPDPDPDPEVGDSVSLFVSLPIVFNGVVGGSWGDVVGEGAGMIAFTFVLDCDAVPFVSARGLGLQRELESYSILFIFIFGGEGVIGPSGVGDDSGLEEIYWYSLFVAILAYLVLVFHLYLNHDD